MSITAVRQFSNKNEIRYLITHDGYSDNPDPDKARITTGDEEDDGGEVTIRNEGGASPDLTTDATGGLIKAIMSARTNGYGCCPPGALDQEKARALLLGLDPNNLFGSENIVRASVNLLPMTGTTDWQVDADVDGQGNPILRVAKQCVDEATALLVIRAPASPGA